MSITLGTPNNHFCSLSFELYFKNGSQATPQNSQLIAIEHIIGLNLISNKGFNIDYYFKATATCTDPPYKNSAKSKLFTVNVKSDPSIVENNPYITTK
jgi:hypothetical protein